MRPRSGLRPVRPARSASERPCCRCLQPRLQTVTLKVALAGGLYAGPMQFGLEWASSFHSPMAEFDHSDFAGFFTELWGAGTPPFAWQRELAEKVLGTLPDGDGGAARQPCDGEEDAQTWPDAIALPTGAGKTACIDIAVFALAVRARCASIDPDRAVAVPRRIFFVVDRRIIVDEAYNRARRVARKLERAKTGILKAVADELMFVACGGSAAMGGERPLAVHSLRGGMYRSEAWARNPLQPTIVASTVDQIGSRLLFRAYGRGGGMWPIYAGLIANDSLILLDEAHCAQPFLQTLQAVGKYRKWAEEPLGLCFCPVVMSATPPPDAKCVFRDSSDEGLNPDHPLGRRQLAPKPADLVDPVKPRNDTGVANGEDAVAKTLTAVARRMLNGQRRAIVVFANRVSTARMTGRLLRDSSTPSLESVLLTGRMRSVDREAVGHRLRRLELHSDQSTARVLEKPVVVVATQTLEVGADLDFDGLVTECASLDALRQRFGRLNRMGRDVECRAAIVIRADQASPKRGCEGDPVYGKALNRTWKWLKENKDSNDRVDFGIAAMEILVAKLDQEKLSALNAPAPSAPVMLPAHVDCWAQTSPEPCPSPDAAPFLRGPRRGTPDMQVCWRADIDLSSENRQKAALDSLGLCPPSSGETLPVPFGVFKRWLSGGDHTDDRSADIPYTNEEEGETGGARAEKATAANRHEIGTQADRRVIRWRGRQTGAEDITSTPKDVRPGDVIVIPTSHPGPWSALGDLVLDRDADPALLDVGDRSYRIARAKPVLRLHRALASAWPDTLPAKVAGFDLLSDLERRYEEEPDQVTQDLRSLLDSLAASIPPNGWDWLTEAAGELATEFRGGRRLQRECHVIDGASLVLVGRRRIAKLAGESDAFSDEDDASASGTAHSDSRPVPLNTHLPGVEEFARRHAAGAGLPDPLVDAIARAGLLHDVGKADPRFQSLLRGGLAWGAAKLLAKSAQMPKTRGGRRRARESEGYPEGGRHELLSVRLAESAPMILPLDKALRDLVLHLVASHHGYCRPFAPVVSDKEAPKVAIELRGHYLRWSGPTGLERLDSGIADRFWRLTRRYGWWGLAWLEGLLRLADWRRSEWEEGSDADE